MPLPWLMSDSASGAAKLLLLPELQTVLADIPSNGIGRDLRSDLNSQNTLAGRRPLGRSSFDST